MTVTPAGTKWALAVISSMTASPCAALVGQDANRVTPRAPNARNPRRLTPRTMIVCILSTHLDLVTVKFSVHAIL
jgi:hypothetical protein